MADYKLNKRIAQKVNGFVAGFHLIIPPKWLRMFTESEIQKLISGTNSVINVKEWKESTQYTGGFKSSSKMVKYFWKAVGDMSEEDKCATLKFVTSCSRPPLMGFKSI